MPAERSLSEPRGRSGGNICRAWASEPVDATGRFHPLGGAGRHRLRRRGNRRASVDRGARLRLSARLGRDQVRPRPRPAAEARDRPQPRHGRRSRVWRREHRSHSRRAGGRQARRGHPPRRGGRRHARGQHGAARLAWARVPAREPRASLARARGAVAGRRGAAGRRLHVWPRPNHAGSRLVDAAAEPPAGGAGPGSCRRVAADGARNAARRLPDHGHRDHGARAPRRAVRTASGRVHPRAPRLRRQGERAGRRRPPAPRRRPPCGRRLHDAFRRVRRPVGFVCTGEGAPGPAAGLGAE